MSLLSSPRWLTLLLALVGGLLTDTAFPQRSWWPMAFVGIALLVLALGRDSARWAWLVGFTWGLAFFLPHIWWANEAVGVIPWVALSVAEAGIAGLACATWIWVRRIGWVERHRIAQPVAFAIVWVTLEQLRQVWPFGGFPWGRLAFSQTDGPLLALASVAGAPLVSAAVVIVGFLLAQAVVGFRRVQVLQATTAALAGAAVVAAAGFIPLPTQAESGDLNLGAVQGNVSEPGLGAFNNAREVLNNHASGTEELAESRPAGWFDLVVWPENSSDINPRVDADAADVIDGAVDAVGAPLLFGTDSYTEDARYNDMVLWMPDGGPVFSYSKQIPAAFAEYIPMRSIARVFSSAVDLVRTDMAPGSEIAVVPVPVARLDRVVDVGTIICFEVAYDALIREAALGGAEVLVVPTNNASFGYTQESTQQFAMSRLRAVEHGRATVQISTVGVSGVIGPDGSVWEDTELFTPAQLSATVPLRTTLTIADRLGDWPVIAALALTLLGLFAGIASTIRRRREDGAGLVADTPGGADAAQHASAEAEVTGGASAEAAGADGASAETGPTDSATDAGAPAKEPA
ncbi:apolipoprotein N-acyltransferase [Occultella kanbiaonis]|uniref:apolipoprotein N-acyltransferase n=1 Tax=Occultella kanbiaonis TaxID=2675754 RepID=UPI001E5F3EEB|nr:apolipoprotein N-acyltransferase [Occultella kanbiaonis]